MDVFLAFALLASLGGLAVGLIRPGVVRLQSRGAVAARLGTLSLVLFVLVGVFATPNDGVRTSPSKEESAAPIEDASFSSTTDAVPPVGTVAGAEGVPTVPDQEGTAAPLDTPAPPVTSAPAPAAVNQTIDVTKPVSPTAPLMAVVEVVDGDTIKVSVDGAVETIRLIGIDTPETKDPRKPVQCFRWEASAKAEELLAGRRVRLEADDTQDDRDKYGRLLRYVWRDDGLFSMNG
jgi:hypothetical protein